MIQVYTGKGKGKTTAALGLALRAAGAGKKVYICQFLKDGIYCEVVAIRKIPGIKLEQFGGKRFVLGTPSQEDRVKAKQGLASACKAISKKHFDVVILDEVNVALKLGLLELADILALIKRTPAKTELVLTGRCAHPAVIKAADLVSEIMEKKHYHKKGVKARRGIEF